MQFEVQLDMLSRPRARAPWLVVACLYCGLFSIAAAGAAGHSTSGEQESDPYETLAARLIEAPTEADRAALRQANSNLVSTSLESALRELGEAHRSRGEFAAAAVGFRLMQQVAEETGHPAGVASALRNLGVVSRQQQKYDEARAYLQKGL